MTETIDVIVYFFLPVEEVSESSNLYTGELFRANVFEKTSEEFSEHLLTPGGKIVDDCNTAYIVQPGTRETEEGVIEVCAIRVSQ